MSVILVTGGAGFVGHHVAAALLARGDTVRVLDNLDPFYDPALKRHNLERLEAAAGGRLEFVEGDLRDPDACRRAAAGIDATVHLAALAGVRPSILDPARYLDVNVVGTQRLLDALAETKGRPLVFGSSSSVYGGNTEVPYSEAHAVDWPVSPYAASKKAGEVVCHAWHHLTGTPVTCLRLFTVYGPGQRPEMAIHKFARLLLAGEALPFYGAGDTARDYTFVTDIVDGILAALDRARGYRIYNLGGSVATSLKQLVEMLERAFGARAELERLPEQPGDMRFTHADVGRAQRELGWRSRVTLEEGLRQFADWYLQMRAEGRLA